MALGWTASGGGRMCPAWAPQIKQRADFTPRVAIYFALRMGEGADRVFGIRYTDMADVPNNVPKIRSSGAPAPLPPSRPRRPLKRQRPLSRRAAIRRRTKVQYRRRNLLLP